MCLLLLCHSFSDHNQPFHEHADYKGEWDSVFGFIVSVSLNMFVYKLGITCISQGCCKDYVKL